MDLKTIEELNTGYSKHQLYRRVKTLKERELIEVKRGGRNQILLNPQAERVLQRLVKLEDNHSNLQSSLVALDNELLKDKGQKLESDNDRLKNELVARNNVIQRLRKGIFRRAWGWIRSIFSFWHLV